MKKSLIAILMSLSLLIVGCGAKKETTTFTQTPMEGATASIMVEHSGDKVTGISAKLTFDNEKLMIKDEATAKTVIDSFKQSSNLKNAKMKYSEKETVITYDAPENVVKNGENYKSAVKDIENTGYTKK